MSPRLRASFRISPCNWISSLPNTPFLATAVWTWSISPYALRAVRGWWRQETGSCLWHRLLDENGALLSIASTCERISSRDSPDSRFCGAAEHVIDRYASVMRSQRSEERHVGKECRS